MIPSPHPVLRGGGRGPEPAVGDPSAQRRGVGSLLVDRPHLVDRLRLHALTLHLDTSRSLHVRRWAVQVFGFASRTRDDNRPDL